MTPHLAWNSFASVLVRFANSRHPLCRSRGKSHRSRCGRAICRNGSLIGRLAPLLAFILRPSGSNLGRNVCFLGGGNEKTCLCWSNLDCCIGPKNQLPQASGKKDPLIVVHSQTGTAGYSR